MADLDDLSVEQLEAILTDPSKLDELVEDEAEAVADAPEPDTPEPAEAVVEEPETPKAEDTPEPEEDLEKQLLLAKIEELTANQKAMDSRLGKFAGEADYWKRKAEGVRNAPEPEPIESLIDEPEPETRPRSQPRRDSLVTFAVSQAIQAGINEFSANNPSSKDLQADLAAYFSTTNDGPPLETYDDPIAAQQETIRRLNNGLYHVQAMKAAQRVKDIETRRAEQFSRQKEAKQRASVSASGGVPAPKPKPKTLNDMNVEELTAELDRLTQ